jgi:Family of unknown function (DUF6585)
VDAPLGRKLTDFSGRAFRWIDWLILAFVFCATVILPLVIGAISFQQTISNFGSVAALTRSRFWLLLATIDFVVILLYLLYRLLIAYRTVEIFQNGLVIALLPLQHKEITWKEMSGIANATNELRLLDWTLDNRPQARIFPSVGKPIHLDHHITNLPDLIQQVKSQIYPQLWPDYCTQYQSGRSIFFGPITIHRDFIQIRNKKILWEKVSRLAVEGGYLNIVSPEQPLIKVEIKNIPNLELLLQLVAWGRQ